MSDDIDRTDEYVELIADDERRALAFHNGHHPDDPGPTDPSREPPFTGAGYTANLRLHQQDHVDAQPHTEPLGDDDAVFENAVVHRTHILRINQEARRRLDEETREPIVLPPLKRLDDLLAEPDEPTRFLIESVAPAGCRVLLSAQAKSGKTTLIGNLIRSLVDGEPFLGRFEVCAAIRHVVVIDDELNERMLRDWLRTQGIQNTAAVSVVTLRGRVGSFNLFDEKCRTEWAAVLGDLGTDYLIVDCLRPVLDALGLDESHDAGKFLVAFDALLAEAGINDAALVHHMGHNNERSRGDSRLEDWPDAIWRMVRDTGETGTPRYFSASGRDVAVPEGRLAYDPDSRRYIYSALSRVDTKVEKAYNHVIKLLAQHGEMSKSDIEKDLGDEKHTQKSIRDAIAKAVEREQVTWRRGDRGAKMHRIAHPCAGCGYPVSSGLVWHESCPAPDHDWTLE